MEDLTGKQLGRYQIVAPLGEGGMAVVYKAYQPSMERYVAIKILPRHYAADPNFVGRFKQEAKVIASLQHLNILPVHDYGEADGYTYIVMRYIEGGTLADLLQGQPLPVPKICHIISQIGDALDYAHSRGVVHRDVKPSNVLIDERGNCLLTDFGIARIIEATARFTVTGSFVGTPTYASPEQGLGQDLDGRSDIYSLGVVLYEMATGRPPFEAETPMEVVVKHIHESLSPPRTINPALPEAVERVILKALAKKPDDRYQTVGEMVRALAAFGREEAVSPELEPQPAVAPRLHPERGRRIPAWGWILGSLVALGVLVELFVGGVQPFGIALHVPPTPTNTPTLVPPAVAPTLTNTPTLVPPTATPVPVAVPMATPVPTNTLILPTPTSTPLTSPPPESPETGPHPTLAVSLDNQIHLAWADRSSGTWDVYYAHSTEGGATFSKAMQVDTEATGAMRGYPTMAVGPDGRVHIAWEDRRSGNWDIYYAHSDDGEAFLLPVRVNDDATHTDQVRPALAVERDGSVYLAWQDGRDGEWNIYYARSADGGVSFGANVRVNQETRDQQVTPAIGVDGQGRVFVAWAGRQSGSWAIYYAHSEGEGFGRGQVVGSGLMSDLSNELPALAVGPDGGVHMAWANAYVVHPTYGVPLYLPVYAASTGGGETFSDPRQVGEGYRYVSVRPPETGVAADGTAVHVVLTTYSPRDGGYIWYYRAAGSTQAFSVGVEVSQAAGGDVLHYPVVAVDQKGRIHVAWAHQRGDEWDVYYVQSGDGGVTFSSRTKLPGGK